jgi:hypothetical protein
MHMQGSLVELLSVARSSGAMTLASLGSSSSTSSTGLFLAGSFQGRATFGAQPAHTTTAQTSVPAEMQPYVLKITDPSMGGERDHDYEDKPVWPTWAAGVLSGVRDVETYNRGRPTQLGVLGLEVSKTGGVKDATQKLHTV